MSQPYATAKMTGGPEIIKVMNDLPKACREKVYEQSLRKGANIFRDEARLLAPSEKGFSNRRGHTKTRNRKSGQFIEFIKLKREIKVSLVKSTDVSFHFAIHIGRAFWGLIIEFGRGVVEVAKAQVLSDGSTIFGKKVASVAARPFMRPAYENKKVEALKVVGEGLGTGIEKTAAKLAGPLAKSGLLRRR